MARVRGRGAAAADELNAYNQKVMSALEADYATDMEEKFGGASSAAKGVKPQGLCDRLGVTVHLAIDAMARLETIEARLSGTAGSITKKTADAPPEPALTLSDRLSAMLVEINKRLQVISQSL